MFLEKIFENNSFFHFGIVVSDIDDWLKPLEALFGTKVSSRRFVDHAYLGRLVGKVGSTAEIAMLPIGGHQYLELLRWGTETTLPGKVMELTAEGTTHLCLYTDDAEKVFSRAKTIEGIELLAPEVSSIPIGPNQGAKVFFLNINKKLFIEIFQRPS